MTDTPYINRESFITLYRSQLFTAEQVCDIVQDEREKWIQKFDSALYVAGNDRDYERHNLLEVIKELRKQEQP